MSLHFIGVGGIGMSAIARIILARGETVSGSDVADSPLLDELRAAGAAIAIGHDAKHVNGARAVVVSSAIDANNVEYAAAVQRGIPVVARGEMLARLMEGHRGIAVCGTHGKTTTTAMLATILREGGVDAGLVLGGIDTSTGTNAHDGSGPWFLTEADESDGSFALLAPAVAILTNVENDHLSSDAEMPKLVASFENFFGRIPPDGTAIAGIDNQHARAIASVPRSARTVTFGFSGDAAVRGSALRFEKFGAAFEVLGSGKRLGAVRLNVPGAMNVQNALAAIAAAGALDLPFETAARALEAFRGVRRRFEVVARTDRMIVVDDYAHHPTAIRETIAAARCYHHGPILAAFQPHRYSRTAYLAPAFAEALADADAVYLAPIYAASETPIDGVSERSIGVPLQAAGVPVTYVKYVHDLRSVLRDAPANALVLMLGAGNITKVAADLAHDLTAS